MTRKRESALFEEQRMATLSWHPRLPEPPQDFPDTVDFSLSREEAEFIRDRIQIACPNSLLSFLALHCEPAETNAPWEHTGIPVVVWLLPSPTLAAEIDPLKIALSRGCGPSDQSLLSSAARIASGFR